MQLARVLSISAAVLCLAASRSEAVVPLDDMSEVGQALLACWKAPANSKGSSVTLSFSFKRDGTLIGRPRPTQIDVAGDAEARQRFVDAAVAAVESCVPLEFSPGLAEGVAGQVFTLRFVSPENGTISPAN